MGYLSFNLSDSSSRDYADSVSRSMDQKASVRAVATSNLTLSGAQTIDGVSLIAGDRALAAGQTLGQNNGIYVVGTPWVRATDADASAEVTAGMLVPVTEGTLNADTVWALTTNDAITLGTTVLAFAKQSGVDIVASVVANTAALLTKAPRRLAPNSQAGTSYTLVQGDEDTGVEGTNAGATTFTAPQLAVGTQIPVYQMGAGKITIAAGSGVTLRAPLGAKTLQQYVPILLWWRSATEVVISGATSVS